MGGGKLERYLFKIFRNNEIFSQKIKIISCKIRLKRLTKKLSKYRDKNKYLLTIKTI